MNDLQILLITTFVVIVTAGYLWLCDRLRG
jgi:hypothetical protein